MYCARSASSLDSPTSTRGAVRSVGHLRVPPRCRSRPPSFDFACARGVLAFLLPPRWPVHAALGLYRAGAVPRSSEPSRAARRGAPTKAVDLPCSTAGVSTVTDYFLVCSGPPATLERSPTRSARTQEDCMRRSLEAIPRADGALDYVTFAARLLPTRGRTTRSSAWVTRRSIPSTAVSRLARGVLRALTVVLSTTLARGGSRRRLDGKIESRSSRSVSSRSIASCPKTWGARRST